MIISQGYHPSNIKAVQEVVVKKLGKLDYLKLKAYRVILLINCISKEIEKIVMVRITSRLEETTKLHKKQIGFRWKRSIMYVLVEIIHRIKKAWKENKYILLLIIDIKVACAHVSKN